MPSLITREELRNNDGDYERDGQGKYGQLGQGLPQGGPSGSRGLSVRAASPPLPQRFSASVGAPAARRTEHGLELTPGPKRSVSRRGGRLSLVLPRDL